MNFQQKLEKLTGIKYGTLTEEQSIQKILEQTGMTMEQYKEQEKAFNF